MSIFHTNRCWGASKGPPRNLEATLRWQQQYLVNSSRGQQRLSTWGRRGMLFSRLKHFQERFVIFDTQGLPSCAVVLLSKASCDHRVLLHFCLKAVMLADEWLGCCHCNIICEIENLEVVQKSLQCSTLTRNPVCKHYYLRHVLSMA